MKMIVFLIELILNIFIFGAPLWAFFFVFEVKAAALSMSWCMLVTGGAIIIHQYNMEGIKLLPKSLLCFSTITMGLVLFFKTEFFIQGMFIIIISGIYLHFLNKLHRARAY